MQAQKSGSQWNAGLFPSIGTIQAVYSQHSHSAVPASMHNYRLPLALTCSIFKYAWGFISNLRSQPRYIIVQNDTMVDVAYHDAPWGAKTWWRQATAHNCIGYLRITY